MRPDMLEEPYDALNGKAPATMGMVKFCNAAARDAEDYGVRDEIL